MTVRHGTRLPAAISLAVVNLAAIMLAASTSAAFANSPAPGAKPDPMTVVPDPAGVSAPKLDFTPTPADEGTYDKYYFFNRPETSFEVALADLRNCDGFASGLSSGYSNQATPYPYAGTMAGAAGGVIGNLMVAAIFGSAEKRRLRRVNMRRCMGYKGYSRFGLSKDLWQEFNFEEGFSGEAEDKRQAMLAQQAKVASGPRPIARELGL